MRKGIGWHAKRLREEVDLFVFGDQPFLLVVVKHVVEQHQFSCDQRRAGMPAVAIVALLECVVQRTGGEVVNVSAVAPERVAAREGARDEIVEKVPDVLAVGETREGGVLAPQAEPAMEGYERQEGSLAPAEAHRHDCLAPLLERHGATLHPSDRGVQRDERHCAQRHESMCARPMERGLSR